MLRSLPFCIRTAGARIRTRDSVPLQVSRLLEERVAEAEHVRDVRHWLSLIGAKEAVCAALSAAILRTISTRTCPVWLEVEYVRSCSVLQDIGPRVI
jgi:hypothetical protein